MNIYIDESGSFVSSSEPDSWNVVAAYISPESDNRKLRELLNKTKTKCGKTYNDEIKLKTFSEKQYFDFLNNLLQLKGRLISVATDSSLINDEAIVQHKKHQAEKILKYKDKMHYEEARFEMVTLANKMENISPQLYVQLQCQVELVAAVIERSILYYVQICPANLKKFSWRIDQKNTRKIDYEDAFEKVVPAFLQTRSLKRPFITCTDFNYHHMAHFFFTEKDAPTYLKEQYNINTKTVGALNIRKLFKSDLTFNDSKNCIGIQIADLLASGTRRMLRGQFLDNQRAAELLGRLMIGSFREEWPIELVSFINASIENTSTVDTINICKKYESRLV